MGNLGKYDNKIFTLYVYITLQYLEKSFACFLRAGGATVSMCAAPRAGCQHSPAGNSMEVLKQTPLNIEFYVFFLLGLELNV